jgi:DtxR family transcriptional regulator, Mn-dependent transcriptional regulator
MNTWILPYFFLGLSKNKFRLMRFTTAEENYIKAVYHLQQGQETVSTNALSAELQTKPASVTDMLKKLKVKRIISYEPYHGVKLSTEGRKVALSIIRKHRLWEYFLVDKLQFGWDEVHEVAEELEHVSSSKLVDKLDAFLGYPKFDPHGDPIPDSKGRIALQQQELLSSIAINKLVEITAVGSQSTELLELLKHKGLQMGTRLEVKKIFEFDGSLELRIKNQQLIMISRVLASVLFVKQI